MPRRKASFNSVDLSRALKVASDAGLTISFTRIDPDGGITLGHSPSVELPEPTADQALAAWEARRRLS